MRIGATEETYASFQLAYREEPLPDDWRKWPPENQKAADFMIHRLMDRHPDKKIVEYYSYCARRLDLDGRPLMLVKGVKLGAA